MTATAPARTCHSERHLSAARMATVPARSGHGGSSLSMARTPKVLMGSGPNRCCRSMTEMATVLVEVPTRPIRSRRICSMARTNVVPSHSGKSDYVASATGTTSEPSGSGRNVARKTTIPVGSGLSWRGCSIWSGRTWSLHVQVIIVTAAAGLVRLEPHQG